MPAQEGHEIVIIRRKIDDEDEAHHGGVWKIAFADFMTAMMAFFLVMWLISANEKTRATIARYFNPIKFEETTPNRKGIRDPQDVESKEAPKGNNVGDYTSQTPPPDAKHIVDTKQPLPAASSPPPNNSAAANQSGAAQNPNSPPSQNLPAIAARQGAGSSGSGVKKDADTGGSLRDPFAPSAEETAVRPTLSPAPAVRPSTSPPRPSPTVANPAVQTNISNGSSPESANLSKQPIEKPTDQPSPQSSSQADQIEATKLRADISSALKDGSTTQPGPAIEVRTTDEGTLISLMDEAGFAMFAVGSARPQPRVIGMMEKVAQILKSRRGSIIIRGHTDGRVYKSATYDNWRLSADRADAARDMLVSGGLDEKRIQRIEGFADRQLKKPNEPDAAENRRIEILLKVEKP